MGHTSHTPDPIVQDRTRDVVKIQSAVRMFLVRNRRFHLLAKARPYY